jgi:hypothetical protein
MHPVLIAIENVIYGSCAGFQQHVPKNNATQQRYYDSNGSTARQPQHNALILLKQ